MTRQEKNGQPTEGLDPETAKLVESIHGKLEQLDLFTLLDIDLNADADRVRRGYFARSRIFHPDRYYTRDLGAQKKMLERVFAWATAAYDFLKDDKRRAAYRKLILTNRDQGSGARVVAVETERGMAFKIVDEQVFYADDAGSPREPESSPEVKLPQKRYSLPRLRPTPPPDDEEPGDR